MNAIVFSRNRAMQLDAFLKTVKKYAPFLHVTVIYKSDSRAFYNGYEIVKNEHQNVLFLPETNFRKNVLDSLSDMYSVFFCDDDLFFKKVEPVLLHDDELCYSFRHGLNTVYSYTCRQPQKFKGKVIGDRIEWNWDEAEYDFNIPFSVDGHVFKTEAIKQRLLKFDFSNPHLFEFGLSRLDEPLKKIVSATTSSLVGIPHNRVSTTIFNFRNAGGSALELNERYLAGERIMPFKMNYSSINSVHCELAYVIEKMIF